MTLNKNIETFIVYFTTLSTTPIIQVYPSYQAQVRLLLANKAFIKDLSKYLDYIDVFLSNLIMELLENTSMNEYIIKLIKDKQPPYRPIYNLRPVKIEILKIYIKIYLKTRFIQLPKSSIDISIFFNQKTDRSLHFYINYQVLNNLIIKNQYFLSLIGKAFDKLSWAKYLI